MKCAPLLVIVPLASLAHLAIMGCSGHRSEDVAAIKKNCEEFRTALMRQDYGRATNYISSALLARFPNPQEMIRDYFRTYKDVDMQLKGEAWVKFDRRSKSNAFLFPHRPPTVEIGFVEETNGWKITVKVHSIVD